MTPPRPPAELRAAVAPLTDDLRRGLRDLPAGDLTPGLRRVTAATGRSLPPPLMATLLREVEESDWLRDKLAESLEPEPGTALHGYLVRPPGWWFSFVAAAVEQATPEPAEPDADRIGEFEERLAEAKRRTADLRGEVDRRTAEIRELRRRLEVADAGDETRKQLDAVTRDRDRLADELEAVRRSHLRAEERIADLRRRRTSEEGAAPPTPAPERVVGALEDPVAAARKLDLAIASLAAGRRPAMPRDHRTGPDPGDVPVPRLTLPPGIRPDTPSALDWLFSLDDDVTILVDGYNVTYLLDKEEFATGQLRRRLVRGLSLLRQQTGMPHRITVVFDSAMSPGEPEVRPGGVEVRFTSAGVSADDEIVRLVAEIEQHPVVVISDDRELRERADGVGALTLWSGPLAIRIGI